MVNEIFRKPTVPHGSTKYFSSNGNLHANFFREHDSEPEAARLSSVKNVTATRTVQTHRERFAEAETKLGTQVVQFDFEV
jgi:hypothetical protein